MTETAQELPDPSARPLVEPCCERVIETVASLRTAAVCGVCGARYVPGPLPRVPVVLRPGLDVRDPPPPRARPSRMRTTEPESAEVTQVRRLLCELRPESSGPLGWGPYELPPPEEVRPTPPVRVQNGAPDVDIPSGAFQRPCAELLSEVRRAIDLVSGTDDTAGRVLVHLQRRGTLHHGFAALCVGVAHAVADRERLDRWRADPIRAWDRARIWGASRVDTAAQAWDRARALLDGRSSA